MCHIVDTALDSDTEKYATVSFMLNNKSNLLLPSSPDTRISVLPYKAKKEVSVHFPGKQILHFGFAEQNYVLNMKHVSRGYSV